MAPSALINVRSFRDQFAGLVRSQKDHGLFNTESEWSDETKQEVASRCKIADDLSFSNAAFVNPTLFHMLRQHREFNEATERELLQKKREEAAELEKRRQKRLFELQSATSSRAESQQAYDENVVDTQPNANSILSIGDEYKDNDVSVPSVGDTSSCGVVDSSMLLAVDVSSGENELDTQAMDIDANTVEDALARLAGRPGAISEHLERNNDTNDQIDSTIDVLEAIAEEEEAEAGIYEEGLRASANSSYAEKNIELEEEGEGEAYVPTTRSRSTRQSKNGRGDRNEEERVASNGNNDENNAGISDDQSSYFSSSEDDQDEDGDQGSKASSKDADNIAGSVAKTPARKMKPEEIILRTPQSELPQGITQDMLKKAIANSGFVRSNDIQEDTKRVVRQRTRVVEPAGVSELESKFRSVRKLLDESTLASLRKANRRMVPPKYRLEVNFMTNRVQAEPMPAATPVADDEVILSVCFYNTRSSTSKMEEYLVLGSQSLTVLRDAFYCISDFLVSHHDEQIENTKDRKVSSSYFFIEKTFYNDMRSPTATDYSRVVMEWANDPERQAKTPKLQGLQSRLMDGARFLDLSIRLRQPYLFVHQGDCEHVMMFTDLRLLGPKDDQFVESYPKQIFRTRHMRHKCRMCSAYPAQYVTKNDFHSGMSPCYFCEKCYTPFHFDANDNKALEHDVFPYANVNLM